MYVIPVWPRYIRSTLQITWLVSSVRKNTSAFLRDVKEIPREQKVAGTLDQTHLLDNPCPCYSLEVFSEAMIFHSCLGLWTVAFGERLPEELLLICLWSFSRGGLFCKIKRQLQKPSWRLQLLQPLLLWDTESTLLHRLRRAAFIAHLYFQQNILPAQQQWPKTTLHFSPGTHFILWLQLYTAGAGLQIPEVSVHF